MDSTKFGSYDFKLLVRLVCALERIADAMDNVTDNEKLAIRTDDVGRAKVYATHLGKKLSDGDASTTPRE